MFDLRSGNAEFESKVKEALASELTLAISQLQALEVLVAEDDFKLKQPADYEEYQRIFLKDFVNSLRLIMQENKK